MRTETWQWEFYKQETRDAITKLQIVNVQNIFQVGFFSFFNQIHVYKVCVFCAYSLCPCVLMFRLLLKKDLCQGHGFSKISDFSWCLLFRVKCQGVKYLI